MIRRRTKQMSAVLAVIRESSGPLSVEEILAGVRHRLPKTGVATIYRNVKRLIEGKSIRHVLLPDGQSRYEAYDKDHHHHFQCRHCERIYDIFFCPVTIPVGTVLPNGFQVDDHTLTMYGVCADCAASDHSVVAGQRI